MRDPALERGGTGSHSTSCPSTPAQGIISRNKPTLPSQPTKVTTRVVAADGTTVTYERAVRWEGETSDGVRLRHIHNVSARRSALRQATRVPAGSSSASRLAKNVEMRDTATVDGVRQLRLRAPASLRVPTLLCARHPQSELLAALRSRSTRRPRHEAENHQVLTAGVREAAEILVAIESTGGA